jgi:hypothetical protein
MCRMGAEEGGRSQMASKSSPHGLLLWDILAGAGSPQVSRCSGCKLCPRLHDQPRQLLALIPAAGMFTCRLTETGYTREVS